MFGEVDHILILEQGFIINTTREYIVKKREMNEEIKRRREVHAHA